MRAFQERCIKGRAIVHTTKRYEAETDNLTEVLTDLLIYAEDDGRDFDKALTEARQKFALLKAEAGR